ncbi:MAG: ParB N-terminal domain-containing protein, partial [Pseudobdellovibrionaceae bacterium]
MAKKLALGKGIASLLQDSTPQSVVNQTYNNQFAATETAEKEVEIRIENTPLLVDVSAIKTNPNQPRKIFKEKDLDELAESIKENGIIQPLIVAEFENGQYELVAGERRLRAAKKAGLEQVPVVVKRATDRE